MGQRRHLLSESVTPDWYNKIMARLKNDPKSRLHRLMGMAHEQGWEVRRTGGGHLRWVGPDGQLCHTGSTLSDWRAIRNIECLLRRLGLDIPR